MAESWHTAFFKNEKTAKSKSPKFRFETFRKLMEDKILIEY